MNSALSVYLLLEFVKIFGVLLVNCGMVYIIILNFKKITKTM